MDQSDSKGAFGETLARYYHQSESKTAVTSWPEQSTFATPQLEPKAAAVSTAAVCALYSANDDPGYRRINHATIERTALTISIVVIGKKNLNPGRSMTMSPGR